MKNLIIILISIIIIPTSLFSQDKQMKKLFNQYENITGFDLEKSTSDMNIDMDKHNDFTELLNNVKEIYVLNIEGEKGNSQSIEKFRKEINKLIDKNGYNSLLDISSDGVFKMLIKRDNNDKPTDVIIINEDDDESTYIWATK